MEDDFKFLRFILQEDEKMYGIAEVMAYGKIIFRYKIIKKKDGSGFFPASPSLKVTEFGEDRYKQAFELDSNYENNLIKDMVMHHAKKHINDAQGNNSANENTHSSSIKDIPEHSFQSDQEKYAVKTNQTQDKEEIPF